MPSRWIVRAAALATDEHSSDEALVANRFGVYFPRITAVITDKSDGPVW
jgi:hypothetical protein